eukprot:gene25557-28879_t
MIHGSICCFPIDHEQGQNASFKVGLSIAGINHQATPVSSPSSSLELKTIHSTDRMTGASVGHSSSRWVVSTHMKKCNGVHCKCHQVCEGFLRDDSPFSLEELVNSYLPIFETELTPPFLFVLSQGDQLMEIKSLSSFVSPVVRHLTPGNYALRDCSCWPARLPVPPSNQNLQDNSLNSPSSARQYHLNSDVFIEDPVREWIQAQRSHEQKLSASFTDMHLEKMHMDENISEEMLNRRFNSKKRARDDTYDTAKIGEATASAISKMLQA